MRVYAAAYPKGRHHDKGWGPDVRKTEGTDVEAYKLVVLAPNSGRSTFKTIFAEAQNELRTTFGMEMTELPTKEKITISQKRGPLNYPSPPFDN